MKKIYLILVLIFLFNLNIDKVYCDDKDINLKLNKFISNQIESKQILSYIDCNYYKLENKKLKKDIIIKFINYNESYIEEYQNNFNLILKNEVNSIQSKQNLKSEINSLNKLCKYEDIYRHEFKFIDNKPKLVKALKDIYCSGYKIDFLNKKFVLTINYDFLNNAY